MTGMPALRCGAQAIGHGVDVGVDAGADVLQVDDEHVDEVEHLGRRLAGLAIQREDRDAAARVGAVRRLDHVVLEIGAEAVLRPEDRGEFEGRRFGELIDHMAEGVVDGRGVGQDADAQPVEARGGDQPFGTEQHGVSARGRKGGGMPPRALGLAALGPSPWLRIARA